jgi:phospholipid-translocating ATPase
MGYYRQFIRDNSTIAEPLTNLTKKNAPKIVKWSDEAENAFQKLKEMLTTAALMRNPDFSRTFVLQTNASGVGVGAVLSQGEQEDQPIAYYRRKLLPRERIYSTVEKQCLAIVLAIKHFSACLMGRHILIQTDHRAYYNG